MTDLEKAKTILSDTASTCVLCLGETIYTSQKQGIAPMLDFLAAGTVLRHFSAADKIIGKAAAMLFALAGVDGVYGEIMSKEAVPIFKRYNIDYSYSVLTDRIINRSGDGICPMEQAVENIDEPSLAEKAIRGKLKELSRG